MDSANRDYDRGSAMRSLLLSVISPGLGEIRNGDFGKGILLTMSRAVSLLFPGIYLYSKTTPSLFFCIIPVAIISLTALYSPYAAFSGSSVSSRRWWRSVPALLFWGIAQWTVTVFSAYVFIALTPVYRTAGNQGYPQYPTGSVLVTSVRAPSSYNEGDAVMIRYGGGTIPVRIITADEGSYSEYKEGRISILGEELPQTVRSAAELEALGFGNDENIYAEIGRSRVYYIARIPGKGKQGEGERFVVSKGEVLVCPDNRIAARPSVIRRDAIISRVEFALPLSWRSSDD